MAKVDDLRDQIDRLLTHYGQTSKVSGTVPVSATPRDLERATHGVVGSDGTVFYRGFKLKPILKEK